jgi:ABC-type sugar transport system ATPase subunit
MADKPPILEALGVNKRFGNTVALKDATFICQPGSIHALIGENGAGKSTLMKIIAGVIGNYEGELRLRGVPVNFAGTSDAQDAGVGIIHQELNLVEQLSAAANVFSASLDWSAA